MNQTNKQHQDEEQQLQRFIQLQRSSLQAQHGHLQTMQQHLSALQQQSGSCPLSGSPSGRESMETVSYKCHFLI